MTFNSVRPIYEYSQTWDFKAYKAQQHSVTTLREQMQRIGVWVNELEKMRARQPCGILEVQSCCVTTSGGAWGGRSAAFDVHIVIICNYLPSDNV